MSKTYIPQNYKSLLGLYDTQKAIGLIKTIFQEKLCAALHLKRVTAPLFVEHGSGLNDDLNGVERPVRFDVPCLSGDAEVVHSLAKWKRYALYKYGFRPGQGLVCDMNAIRRDEEPDNLHSIYVDQWDWERVITARQRTLPFLKDTVRDIVDAVCATADELRWKFPELKRVRLGREVTFITTQELEDLYPALTPKERENAFAKEHGTICLLQIGGKLASGRAHDGRAPDYDDWTLNCDILFWHKPLGCALELSSMGIPCRPRRAAPPAGRSRLPRARRAAVPQNAAGGRAAADDGRRHRPKPAVHAAAGQGACRRGTGELVGQRDPRRLRRRRGGAAVSAAQTDGAARLEKFEAMLAAVQAQYADTTAQMERLKAAGRVKSATYRQLFAKKLNLQDMLTFYEVYGLL